MCVIRVAKDDSSVKEETRNKYGIILNQGSPHSGRRGADDVPENAFQRQRRVSTGGEAQKQIHKSLGAVAMRKWLLAHSTKRPIAGKMLYSQPDRYGYFA